MRRLIIKIILFGSVISFACVNGYTEDKGKDNDYASPNYNDPSKPNYMRGTRTDMAPKVEIPDEKKKEEKFCEPSESIKKEFNRLEEQRGDKSEIILFGDTVSGYRRLQEDWDKECEEKERNKNKYPSQTVLSPAE